MKAYMQLVCQTCVLLKHANVFVVIKSLHVINGDKSCISSNMVGKALPGQQKPKLAADRCHAKVLPVRFFACILDAHVCVRHVVKKVQRLKEGQHNHSCLHRQHSSGDALAGVQYPCDPQTE